MASARDAGNDGRGGAGEEFETSSPTRGIAPGPVPDTPAFPPAALHQPKSRRLSYSQDAAATALPYTPASPSALPELPPTPGLAKTMSTVQPHMNGTDADGYPAGSKPRQHGEGGGAEQEQKQDSSPAWSPAHPCFPHPNPHVPLTSPLYDTTRIIRIPRDWMAAGDLYPAFSTTYPEILIPWVSEESFRLLVNQINDALKRAFEPATGRAVLEGMLGLLSGWLLEDVGVVGPKKRIKYVEAIIENWNAQHERSRSARVNKGFGEVEAEGQELVKVVPLRRTAYMSLDIQIPDPKIQVVADGDSQASGRSSRQDGGEEEDEEQERSRAVAASSAAGGDV